MSLIDSSVEVISFDIGDTLINLDGIEGFCTFFCKKTGLEVDDIRSILNEYFLKRNIDIESSVREVCSILNINDYEDIISEYKHIHMNPKVFSDVISTLTQLKKRGYTIIACSNCVKWDADDPGGILHDNIDNIFYSFEIGFAKPEIAFFEYVSNLMQKDVSKFLHIGDSLKADYYAAKDAGWKSLLLDRKNKYKDLSVSKISSLKQLL